MNKHLHLTLGFVTGVAVGASVMSLYLNRKHGEKLDILKEEWLKPIEDFTDFVEEPEDNEDQEEFVKIVSGNYVSDEENSIVIDSEIAKSPVRDASKEINNKHTPVDYTTFVENRKAVDDIAKGQLSMSIQDDGSFVFKEHGKEDAEVIDIYDEEVQNPKIVGKSGIEVIHDEEMYGDDDYTYYEKLTLMYYDDDHTLTDDSDIPIDDIYKLVGDNLDLFEDQDVIYLRNHDLETDFEVVRIENSYSKSVLGIDQ